MALNLPEALAEANAAGNWKLVPITRPASSAPSVGSAKVHEEQQRALTEAALA
jgi:2-oxoglutarate dehydrogenase E1 component